VPTHRNTASPASALLVQGYDARVAAKIVERIASGALLKDVLGLRGAPSLRTWRRWRRDHPELDKAHREARALAAEALEEEALGHGRALVAGAPTSEHIRATAVLLDQLRWSASRRDPAQFGDAARVQVKVPVQIITSLDLGQPGAQEREDEGDLYTITVEPTPIPAPAPALVGYDPKAPRKKVLRPALPMSAPTPPANKDAWKQARMKAGASKRSPAGTENAKRVWARRKAQQQQQETEDAAQ